MRLVLVQPRVAENLGAAARAMKNFGLREWIWVRSIPADLEPARRLAVHAADLLEAARLADSLEAATADCVWVVGTSSRHVSGKRRLSPREAARALVERAAHGPVALVFGDEENGLSNAEVDRCHALSAAPTATEQPSLNLAQAVLLYAYELRLAALDADPPAVAPLPALATASELDRVEEALRGLLAEARFLDATGERHAVRDLMAPLARAHLTRAEARLWLAALSTADAWTRHGRDS